MAAKKTGGAKVLTPEEREAQVKAMSVLFTAPEGFNEEKLQRRNLPRMVRPNDVPIGAIVSGEILAIVDSPVSTIKGKLLHLKHHTGQEFLMPCTGVIRQALAPGREKDEAALKKTLEGEVGKLFYAKRLDNATSSKYKKDMFMFDVYTSKK